MDNYERSEKIDPYGQRNQDQTEKEFAERVLSTNQDLLVNLARIAGGYAEQGDAAAFYIIVKAINMTLQLAQGHMKQSLGIDAAKLN